MFFVFCIILTVSPLVVQATHLEAKHDFQKVLNRYMFAKYMPQLVSLCPVIASMLVTSDIFWVKTVYCFSSTVHNNTSVNVTIK